MNERLNKPRVFLSHSKKDAELIRRLYDDLRRCQIEPWLDEIDIRPGKPWLDAIFEEGIPTCDCVFIYLTENSVSSAMVKKELDAAVLGQLEDNKIALLPYVSSGAVRASLRADIRSLQVPALNEENYPQILSQLVAEIWRSFMERTVAGAVQHERVKRLEAELELEKIRNASGDGIFTDAEEKEFVYKGVERNTK
ncbi:MAG: toll/interleukin-1 receptor domain-containing protein [Candidatus Electrothrix sp. GM3_4]|nr:toll/interleukin-1 receptor domain-containing protein [Candidatus Electrothrix sp. GM3_4]